MTVIVNAKELTISCGDSVYPCRIGRDGFIAQAQGAEGDYKTPLGLYNLRYGYYRADRVPSPNSALLFHPIQDNDGWCDATDDIAYNLPVRLPYPASAERLHKDEGVYDIVIVLGHNDSPPQPGLGSAIFLHICRIDDGMTAGCIAVTPNVMAQLLTQLEPNMRFEITA